MNMLRFYKALTEGALIQPLHLSPRLQEGIRSFMCVHFCFLNHMADINWPFCLQPAIWSKRILKLLATAKITEHLNLNPKA